jgi:hypothetical protein
MQLIEKAILQALVLNLSAIGYKPVAFWDGEEYQLAGNKTCSYRASADPKHAKPDVMTEEEVLAAVDSVDEGTLHFAPPNGIWGARGILLVGGNGVDLISDYHVADQEPLWGETIRRVCRDAEAGNLGYVARLAIG